MRFAKIIRLRIQSLVSRGRVDQDLDDELRFHVEQQMEADIAAGMSPQDARHAALRSVESLVRKREECRDMRGLNLLDDLQQDVRFALRQLRKNPGFTCTAIFMLALGLCASVAIFAFVDAALLQPLPYANPTRLAGVYEKIPLCPQCNVSYLDYVDLKKLNTVFSSMAAYGGSGAMLRTPTGTELAPGARVTAGFFRTLGVKPALGRDFVDGEDRPGAARTLLLSYGAWQKRYGGKKEALGQTITINGEPSTIIGVLPADFHFALVGSAEFWSALQPAGGCETRRSCHNLYAIGRLKDGVALDTASANMALIAQQLEKQYPDSNRGQGSNIVSLSDAIVGNIRPMLLVLLGGAALLLLIASVNVASLLLVRSESRRREMAVRSGLGASTARLISQFVTEGLVLVVAGSALGLAAARWSMQLLTGLIPTDMVARMPYLHGLGLNYRVLIFAAVVSLLAAVLFSATPTVRLSLTDLREGLAEGSRGSAGTTWRRLGSNLVVLELATAVVLLVGAGLLGKSLYRVLQVNLGMQPDHLATLRVGAPESTYGKDEQMVALGRQINSRMSGLPGVESVAFSSTLPIAGGNTMWIQIVGRPYNGEHNEVGYREVTANYFTTLRAKLLRGRYFSEAEDASKPRVVIIDRMLAEKYFPGEDPLGKQIKWAHEGKEPPMEIIGVVEDIKEGALDSTTWPTMYVPFNQDPSTFFAIAVRTSQNEESLLPTLVSTINEIDPGLSTFDKKTMLERVNNSPAAYMRRSSATLVGGFAVLALLLGVVGLYGVIAYSVSQRTREIGVRIALGAQQRAVYQLILKEAGWLIGIGIAIGLVCSVAATTLMRGLLFGVHTWDAATLASVAGVLGLSAILASFIPARRAATVNPVEALRAE